MRYRASSSPSGCVWIAAAGQQGITTLELLSCRQLTISLHPIPDSHGIPLSPGGTAVSPPPYPTLEQPASQPPSRPQGQDRTILDPSASSPEKYKLPATLYVVTKRRCAPTRPRDQN